MKERADTPEIIVRRFPRLTSHLICESLGYFTVRAAAKALHSYSRDEPFGCEWYSHISQCRGKGLFDEDEFRRINRDIVQAAIRNRHRHKGYMAEYRQAKALVDRFNATGTQNELASWF